MAGIVIFFVLFYHHHQLKKFFRHIKGKLNQFLYCEKTRCDCTNIYSTKILNMIIIKIILFVTYVEEIEWFKRESYCAAGE